MGAGAPVPTRLGRGAACRPSRRCRRGSRGGSRAGRRRDRRACTTGVRVV